MVRGPKYGNASINASYAFQLHILLHYITYISQAYSGLQGPKRPVKAATKTHRMLGLLR